MSEEKRMLGNYEVTQSIYVGDKEVVLAVDKKEQYPLKLTEISDTLQIGLPLVKYRLRKAKIQLEEVLRKEEYDEFGRKNENV